MNALVILRDLKKETVDGWVEAVFATYPLETTGFLRTKNNPFTNPVAHMTREAADILFDAIIGEDIETDKVAGAIERFVKLRAVQKGEPSKSLGVLYVMKPILRKTALPAMRKANLLSEYLECESRLDTVALLAFDIYMRARETLAESRIREIKTSMPSLPAGRRSLKARQCPMNNRGFPNEIRPTLCWRWVKWWQRK